MAWGGLSGRCFHRYYNVYTSNMAVRIRAWALQAKKTDWNLCAGERQSGQLDRLQDFHDDDDGADATDEHHTHIGGARNGEGTHNIGRQAAVVSCVSALREFGGNFAHSIYCVLFYGGRMCVCVSVCIGCWDCRHVKPLRV